MWFWLFVLFLFFGYLDVFHIAATKDYVVEFLLRGWDEVVGFSTFGTEGVNIFKGDRRLFWIDLMKCANVAGACQYAEATMV